MFKKYNKKDNTSYSIGVFPTIELLKHRGKDVRKVYVSPKGFRNKGVDEIRELSKKLGVQVVEDKKTIDIISRNENTYALGVFNKYNAPIKGGENHLILVEPSDMGNLGTICRTMLAFGVKNLGIIKPAVDIFDPKAIRSSMGAIFNLNFEYFSSFDEYSKEFKNNIYTFMTDGKSSMEEIIFEKPYSLVFGNESSGLLENYKNIGKSVKIGQTDDVDSLNLAIAVGISLYESSFGK